MKQPNVPMSHPITTCRHKVDKEKFDPGWDRIWGKKKSWAEMDKEEHEKWKKAMAFVEGRDD